MNPNQHLSKIAAATTILLLSSVAFALNSPDNGRYSAGVYPDADAEGGMLAQCADNSPTQWCKKGNISKANRASSVKICNNTGEDYDYSVNVYDSDDYRNNLGWPAVRVKHNQCQVLNFQGDLASLDNRMNSMQIVPKLVQD